MNSYSAALSRGRPGRPCILMQSAFGQECIPSAVHCVWKCLSILKARVRCNSGSARSMQSKAQHNLYQRMRARKEPKESHSDPECGSSTSRLRSKTSACSCPGSSLVLWGCWSTGRTERRGALEPFSKLEHGFWPSESCREFRVGTWPRLMLLQSFHLAAMNLHMLLLHPGHFKQTGVSAAVCQTGRGTGGSGHLQAGHRLPQQGRQEHTRPGDSAKGQKCTELQGSSVSDNLPRWPLHKDK